MYKTIVLGLDGSDGAKHAAPFAVALARRDHSRLVLAHIEESVIGKGGGPIRATEAEIQDEIRRTAEELTGEGIPTTVRMTSVTLGGPASALAKIADEEGADLIVVGSLGHAVLAGMFMGSVAQRISYKAHMPVMVIPKDAPQPEAGVAEPTGEQP